MVRFPYNLIQKDMQGMKKRIVIFEAEGGSDKWLDGHRKDTMPIANSIKAKGWECDVVYFRDEWKQTIIDYCKDRYDGYISRVNPGTLQKGEKLYFEALTELSNKHGLIGMSSPQAMVQFGAKDVLTKLIPTGLVPEDTFTYYTIEDFKEKFPKSVPLGERVLKQNRGSTGEGIWRIQVDGENNLKPGDVAPLDTKLRCTEAVDNHVEHRVLDEFMTFCEQYIDPNDNGMLVDMKFLPRIKEGEVRVLLVGPKPIFVVHKKPAENADSFSATLFSGAKYRYDKPEQWPELINHFEASLPKITERLGGLDIPLIWTADFILDWDENKKDIFILGEINCSCVGFTSHLDQGIQDIVAEEVISRVEKKYAK